MSINKIMRRVGRRWRERLQQHRPAVQFSKDHDEQIREFFLDKDQPVVTRFEQLFEYFATGFLHYSTPYFSKAYYPGAPSINGCDLDAMQGFSRMAPMMAAWVQSGRSPMVPSPVGGPSVDLRHVLRQGLLHGTDPNSKGFWGSINDFNGRIAESADIALSIWLSREHVWPQFTKSQQQQIVKWLSDIIGREVYDNNWHLFPVLVEQVLRSLGHPITSIDFHYERLRSFYQGDGWFSDGPGHIFDYYNAWGIHYPLFWINQVNPNYDSDFINSALDEFVASYKYFFSPVGYPITGRSICYRVGATAPLVMAAVGPNALLSPGTARSALDQTWRYFVEHGSLRSGTLTQGYWRDDLRFLDMYSGPASPLWSLRSLIPAFCISSDTPFWRAPSQALPVEEGSYKVTIPAIRWEIHGDHETQDVRLIKQDNAGSVWRKPSPVTFTDRLWTFASGGACRPKNHYLKYELFEYRALKPFCIVDT